MTESIDFQNGFLCGMATKGLIKTGAAYEPTIWNDEGEYNFFYIDFHRALSPFSEGMLVESLIVHDTVQIEITDFGYVAPGIIKIYADISGKTRGVTVINKASTYLKFANGMPVPAFSVMFYVAGLSRYQRQYWSEALDNASSAIFSFVSDTPMTETVSALLVANIEESFGVETVYSGKTAGFIGPVSFNESVTLTPFEA